MYRMTEAAPESVANTSMEEKEKVLSCYKIAIIGGHDNWTYKLKNKFKNWKFYRPEVTRTIDEKSLQTADYIYFFTDIMSHGSYCRYIKFVREYGLKFGYLHTINIDQISIRYMRIFKIWRNNLEFHKEHRKVFYTEAFLFYSLMKHTLYF